MIRSLYSGVSGMKNHQIKLDVIANNIANVNTTGYKSASVTFEDMVSQTIKNASVSSDEGLGNNPSQIGIGSQVGSVFSSFTQGGTQYTGRALDLYIQGAGFFAVQDINGNTFFTRDGSLQFDSEGYLVTQGGYRVLDSDGSQIQITDAIASLTVNMQGQLTAKDDSGNIIEQKNIGLAYVVNPESLIKKGNNLYAESESTRYQTGSEGQNGIGIAGSEGRGLIQSNMLEMSNVDLSTEFANMIVTQRGYQANARVITVSDQVLEELINLKR